MAEESILHDNTEVAAEEGEALVEEKGKLDEGAKAQQKGVEEITGDEDKVESKRTTPMAETAKEGKDLLDGEELGKTRSQTKNGDDAKVPEENGKEKEDEDEEPDSSEQSNGNHAEVDEPSALKRNRGTEDSIKEGDEIIKKPKVDGKSEEVKA